MAADSERVKILEMIQEGRISAAEGIALLEKCEAQPHAAEMPTQGPRWLHVVVTDVVSGKTHVNVRMPVSLINAGSKLGVHLHSELNGMNMDEVREMIREGYVGTVLDITDEDDERVQLVLE